MNEAKKKKRSFAIAVLLIIMTVALCITLISCGGDEITDESNNKIRTEQSVDAESDGKDAADKEAAAQGDAVEKTKSNDKTNKEPVSNHSETSKAETQETAQKTAEKSTKATAKNSEKTTEKATEKSTKATTKATTQAKTQATTQAKKVCYITIEGYCSGKEISLQGGDTAYSILCRSGASVSGSSHYVKGINGRFEFDEGPTSGWVYYVNGSRPNVGCGSYSIKAGDSITWDYVTKL